MGERSREKADSAFITYFLFVVSFIACFYVAGRLWQDSERRVMLEDFKVKGTGERGTSVNVEDKLQYFGCKVAEQRLKELETELSAARSKGFTNSWVDIKMVNDTKSRHLAVIGIYTEFDNRLKRDAVRRKWIPNGGSLQFLEKTQGVIVRFVIGRSANKGDSSERKIDIEDQENNDFLILDGHIEMSNEYANKAKQFFAVAVESWDADFYVKVDDSFYLNIDELVKLLHSYSDKPRAYIGCMKSGEVIPEEGKEWYEKEWWKFGDGKLYFRHATGQFYVLSRLLARYIYVNRNFLHLYAHEDTSLGSWMLGLDVNHVHEDRLCCGIEAIGFFSLPTSSKCQCLSKMIFYTSRLGHYIDIGFDLIFRCLDL
ncbi:hypothetical protein KP509_32G064800 [Ceratopteris richardii]|uniref:Hexosyltransferase n=1 Tax=Ceratopteris richardii TaxID=49495 RepID=A0A8T2QU20_CERRI|nr:hypothetical protein KP509_32G064800 [Ceratopteris richardii]